MQLLYRLGPVGIWLLLGAAAAWVFTFAVVVCATRTATSRQNRVGTDDAEQMLRRQPPLS